MHLSLRFIQTRLPADDAELKTGSDSGSGAEASLLSAVVAASDTGAGSDASSLSAALSGSETGSGVDTGSVSVPISGSDAGSGAEASSTTASIPTVETGSGDETTALTATAAASETGEGVDSGTVSVPVAGSDTGSGSDQGVVTVPVAGSDTGTGAEGAPTLTADITASDSPSATETAALVATASGSDVGSGSDTGALVAASSGSDTGSGSDSVVVSVPISASDVGTGSELPFAARMPQPMPESDGTLTQVVSPTGNDSTGNGTVGNPWKTINKALTHASLGAGSIIYLRGNAGEHGNGAGTGEGTSVVLTSKYGSAQNPITIETYPGDTRAIINGTRLHLNPGDIRQEDYNSGNGWNFRIRNLHFKGNNGFGQNGLAAIQSNNPINFEISECLFEGESTFAIVIRGMSREQALNGAINDSQTSITLDGTGNLLNATPYYLGITNSTGTADSASCTEIVKVTNVSGNVLTVERGALGSSPVSHINGAKVIGYFRGKNVQIFNNIIRRSGMLGTKVNGAQSINSGGTLTVDDTTVFPSTGSLNNTALVVEGCPVALPYTAKTSTTFTIGTISGGPYSIADNAPVLNSWCSGHAHGIYYGSDWGTREGAIYNNLIYDISGFGITLHEETDDTVIAFNTIDYCGRGGINLASEGVHAGERNVVTSNIVTRPLRRAPIQGTSQSGYAINLWWEAVDVDLTDLRNKIDKLVWDDADSGYHQSEGSSSFPTGTDIDFSGDINQDPLFADRDNGNYGLTASSPAVGAGDKRFMPEGDIQGLPRSTVDAGAYALLGDLSKSGSDSGSGADSPAVSASLAGSDTGTDSEAASLAAAIVGSEVGTDSETSTFTFETSASDSGSGSDSSSVTTISPRRAIVTWFEFETPMAVNQSRTDDDSGSGSDVGVVTAVQIPASDAGTASTETTSAPAVISASDTGAGADAGSTQSLPVVGSDEGTDTETATLAAGLSGSDSGSGTDTSSAVTGAPRRAIVTWFEFETPFAEVAAQRSGSDTGSGADAGTVTVPVAGSDVGSGSDVTVAARQIKSRDHSGGARIGGPAPSLIYHLFKPAGAEVGVVGDPGTKSGSDVPANIGESAALAATAPGSDAGTSTEVMAQTWIQDPVTDSGAESDASVLAASVTDPDAGSGADASSVFREGALSVNDAGTASAETAAIVAVGTAGSDSGSGADTGTLPVIPAVSDTGAGTETAAVNSASISASDAGTSSEFGTTGQETPKAASDSGTGADTSSVTYSAVGSDSGAGLDEAQPPKFASDSGSGADTPALSATASVSDVFSGADLANVLAALASGDLGFDSEAANITVVVFASDAATGAEVSAITAAILAGEVGSGSDAHSLTETKTGTDSGTGTDSSSAATTSVQASEQGSGVDVALLLYPVPASDAGTGTDVTTTAGPLQGRLLPIGPGGRVGTSGAGRVSHRGTGRILSGQTGRTRSE